MTMHFSAVVTEVGKVASLYSQTQQIVLSIDLSKNILSSLLIIQAIIFI